MSEETAHSNGKGDTVVQPFVQLWAEYLKQAGSATHDVLEQMSSAADAEQWRKRWLQAMSDSMDAYMRSPAFLQVMKQNLDTVVKAKAQADDIQKETARNCGVPTASDISGLFQRIHSVEDTILSRLAKIEQRLDQMQEQLGGRPNMEAEAGPKKPRAGRRQ